MSVETITPFEAGASRHHTSDIVGTVRDALREVSDRFARSAARRRARPAGLRAARSYKHAEDVMDVYREHVALSMWGRAV